MHHIIRSPGVANPVIGPSIVDIEAAQAALSEYILTTPVWRCRSPLLNDQFDDPQTEVWLKLELWQRAGSFKARGALLGMLELTDEQKQQGVVAISAGNHAIAVSYAAQCLNIKAQVWMPRTASPIRIAKCKYYGAEVFHTENMQELFDRVEEIRKGRNLIHPFTGRNVTLGTGTLGLELFQQINDIDAVIVAIGGGGLISGIGNAIKKLQPKIQVYGVEPEGAQTMSLSFQHGQPAALVPLNTIADSLAAPRTDEDVYSICCQTVDGIVTVTDNQIIHAMQFLFNEMKLAVEPAAAIGIAALFGPLKSILSGKKVALVISGSNIDEQRYSSLITQHVSPQNGI